MEQRIKKAILSIIKEKLNDKNEAFPCAHSIEVALRLKMNAREVELIAQGIDGITTHLTINGAFYEA